MYTITPQELQSDYNWREAFNTAGDSVDNVTEVIAADAGYNDGDNWIAVVKLNTGGYAVMRAGCDYTGWDCCAGGNIEYYSTVEDAISVLTLTQEERDRLGIS